YGSLTEASKNMYISQPALSRSIKNLENELGVPLFNREGRKIKLNHYGDFFLKKVNISLQAIEDGKRILKESTDPYTGTIRIAFIHTLGNSFIPKVISKFKEEYQNVNFQLYQGTTGVVKEYLDSDMVDLCFLMNSDFPNNIDYDILIKEELFLIVPNSHRLADKNKVSLLDFKNEN